MRRALEVVGGGEAHPQVALVPVLELGRRRALMGAFTTRPAVTTVAGVLAVVVIGVNAHLVVTVFVSGLS